MCVFGSQRQADFHTSALNHNWLPAEVPFLNQRSHFVGNCFPHSCLITLKQKIASTRYNKTEVRKHLKLCESTACYYPSLHVSFDYLPEENKRYFTSLQIVDKLRQVCLKTVNVSCTVCVALALKRCDDQCSHICESKQCLLAGEKWLQLKQCYIPTNTLSATCNVLFFCFFDFIPSLENWAPKCAFFHPIVN